MFSYLCCCPEKNGPIGPQKMKVSWSRVSTAKPSLNKLISSSPTGTGNKISLHCKPLSLGMAFHTVVVG